MNRSRHQFFARPRFAQYAHACLAGRYTLNFAHKAFHRRAAAYEFMFPDPASQLLVFTSRAA